MAPGAAIAASIPAGAALAGGSLPLSVVLALVACLFTASSIAELARNMPAAGSLATYAAQGLHRGVGFLVAWGYTLVGVLIPPLVLLQLGFTTASTLNSEFAGYPADLWWPWTLLGALIVAAAGLYGIRTSARLGTVLGVFEIAVFLVLGIMLVLHAGSANTLTVFGTGHTPDGGGISSVIAGSVFTILAFGGFEGAAPLAEEARDPRRTIRRAVLLATLIIGGLYIFTTYAVDVALRTGQLRHLHQFRRRLLGGAGPRPLRAVLDPGLPGHRELHHRQRERGRERVEPHGLRDGAHRRLPVPARPHRPAPPFAVRGDPRRLGRDARRLAGPGLRLRPGDRVRDDRHRHLILLVAIYILANVTCVAYFLRRRRSEFNVFRHLIVPVLGVVAFVPPWLTAAGLPVFDFISPLTPPVSYAGPAVAGWMVLGLAYLGWLVARHPGRLAEVSRVHLDDPA